jgi:uncharacterized protein YoxC
MINQNEIVKIVVSCILVLLAVVILIIFLINVLKGQRKLKGSHEKVKYLQNRISDSKERR